MTTPLSYLRSFRARRAANWMSLGFLYASYYMCRYNFRFAVPGLQKEFGFNINDVSFIFAIWSLAYGVGQLINGLITDSIGGKRGIILGAIGTLIINFTFGFSSLVSHFFSFALLALLNGYLQSFGAPAMIKINAAWFQKKERGIFAGIFGGVIQSGQISVSHIAPALINGGLMIGTLQLAAAGDWRSVFIFPPLFTLAAAIICLLIVKETPEEAGYENVIIDEHAQGDGTRVSISHSFHTVLKNRYVWYYAAAYACTGGVRHSLDQLSILYFRDQLGFDMEKNIPLIASSTLIMMPFFAFLGSLVSGILSDTAYHGERAALAVKLYFIESATIAVCSFLIWFKVVKADTTGIYLGCAILILIALTVNSTHSLIGSAAPMDIGGKKMAGFATGFIDSFQYFGGAFSLLLTGKVLEITEKQYGYLFWYVIMSCFGVIGGISMILLERKKQSRLAH